MHHESVVIHLIHKYVTVLKLSLDELTRISDDIDNELQQTSIMLVVSCISPNIMDITKVSSIPEGAKVQPILEKMVIDMKMEVHIIPLDQNQVQQSSATFSSPYVTPNGD